MTDLGSASPGMQCTPEVRVMVCEQHPHMRTALQHRLNRSGRFVVVAQLGGGDDLVAAYREHTPDLVLISSASQGLTSAAATQALLHAEPQAVIVVLSGRDDPESVQAARDAGAAGYLHKTVPAATMTALLQQIVKDPTTAFVTALPGQDTVPGCGLPTGS